MMKEKIKSYWTEEKSKKILGDKNLWLKPDTDGEFLHLIDILDANARIEKASIKKLFQINHFLRMIEKSILILKKNYKRIVVVDLACGKSYLSLAFFYWIKRFHPDLDVELKLFESQEKIVANIKEKIEKLGWTPWVQIFNQSIIALYDEIKAAGDKRFHLCLALHACDQLTDYALGVALESKADFFAVAPCCQAELASMWAKNKNIESKSLALELWKHDPHLRREAAALLTDSLRVQGLRAIGYEVNTAEFVAFEHSAKNRLISGRRLFRFDTEEQQNFEKMLHQNAAEGIRIEAIIKNRWEIQNPEITWHKI